MELYGSSHEIAVVSFFYGPDVVHPFYPDHPPGLGWWPSIPPWPLGIMHRSDCGDDSRYGDPLNPKDPGGKLVLLK